MAITPELSPNLSAVSLEAFIEKAARTLDPGDSLSALALADDLAALSMNEGLVKDAIEAQIDAFLQGTRQISYTPQSIVLGGGSGFYVRANIWTPTRLTGAIKEQEEKIFSYRLAHDHNFAFLTAGHFGSGYRTEIFEYDPDQITGFIGEEVDLRLLEHTGLPKGKVMFYRERRDIHIQHPPEELSISLNLMLASEESQNTEQYFFDTERRIISGIPEAAYVYRRASLATLLGEIGDAESIPLLEQLLDDQPNRRVRISAMDSIHRLSDRFDLAESVTRRMLRDPDRLVCEAARQLLDSGHLDERVSLSSAASIYKRD